MLILEVKDTMSFEDESKRENSVTLRKLARRDGSAGRPAGKF